jgi:hypothetical protein
MWKLSKNRKSAHLSLITKGQMLKKSAAQKKQQLKKLTELGQKLGYFVHAHFSSFLASGKAFFPSKFSFKNFVKIHKLVKNGKRTKKHFQPPAFENWKQSFPLIGGKIFELNLNVDWSKFWLLHLARYCKREGNVNKTKVFWGNAPLVLTENWATVMKSWTTKCKVHVVQTNVEKSVKNHNFKT